MFSYRRDKRYSLRAVNIRYGSLVPCTVKSSIITPMYPSPGTKIILGDHDDEVLLPRLMVNIGLFNTLHAPLMPAIIPCAAASS